MKKLLGVILALVVIGLLAYAYLGMGTKAVNIAKDAVETGQGQVDQAKQAVDKLNESTRAQEDEARKLLGK